VIARVLQEAPAFFTGYNILFLLQAMGATLLLSLGGCLVGSAVGLGLTLVRASEARALMPARVAAWAFVEFFRRVPPLVVLLLVFFASNLLRGQISLFGIAMIGLCLVATASLTEIIRGGIESVHPAQWESAESLNFGYMRSFFWVVLPQAWRVILPPAVSFMLLFIKDTAFASQVGTLELTSAGKILTTKGFTAALAYGSVLILYFLLSTALAGLGNWLEKRIAFPGNR